MGKLQQLSKRRRNDASLVRILIVLLLLLGRSTVIVSAIVSPRRSQARVPQRRTLLPYGGVQDVMQRLRSRRYLSSDALASRKGGDYTGEDSPNIANIKEAMAKANRLRMDCAKVAAVSAIVDIVLEGKKNIMMWFGGMSTSANSASWLFSLTTLWKLCFSYFLWDVAQLYSKIAAEADVDTFAKAAEGILRSSAMVWRQTGIIVTLLIIEKATLAWRDRIPHVRRILAGLVGVAAIAMLFLSRKENLSLSLLDESVTKLESETAKERISRQGSVTLRAMSLCSAAFLVKAVLNGFIASSQTSWLGIFGELIHIPTSLGFGTLLWKQRKALGPVVKELSDKSNTEMTVSPKATIRLSGITEKFWSKAKGTFILETVSKVVFALSELIKNRF